MSLVLNQMAAAIVAGAGGGGGAAPTWDSADKNAGVTLSNGDLTVTYSSGARSGAGSTGEQTSGAYYFEVVVDTGGGSWLSIGISPKGYARNLDLGQSADGYGYGIQGSKYFDGSYGGFAYSSFTTGDVIGVAFDIDNNTIEFFKNNTSQGSESVTLDGADYAAAIIMDAAGQECTLRTTTAEFSYSVPSGHTAFGGS